MIDLNAFSLNTLRLHVFKQHPEHLSYFLIPDLSDALINFLKANPSKLPEFESLQLPYNIKLRVVDALALQDPRLKNRNDLSPVEQLFVWETESNYQGFERTSRPVLFPVKSISVEDVRVDSLGTTPEWLKAIIQKGSTVPFPVNPLNLESKVPFQDRPTAEFWSGRFSASRSAFFQSGKKLYSLKLPSEYTHPTSPKSFLKADMTKSVLISLNRARHIEAIEKRIGKDPRLTVLRETMAVYDKTTGNGYTVRDLSDLLDGNFYLPSFAVYTVGSTIAARHNQPFEKFWEDHYVPLMGQIQALLALRYGLVMKFPHNQNHLVQLNRDFMPTGRGVVRDMSDTSLIVSIAEVIAPEALQHDRNMKYEVSHRGIRVDLEPIKGLQKFPGGRRLEDRWRDIMTKAFDQTVRTELHIPEETNISKFIESPEGAEAIRQYHDRLAEEHRRGLR